MLAAGVAGGTYLFALPGSTGACKDAWDGILKYQLDIRHKPCNFVELMPRLREHEAVEGTSRVRDAIHKLGFAMPSGEPQLGAQGRADHCDPVFFSEPQHLSGIAGRVFHLRHVAKLPVKAARHH